MNKYMIVNQKANCLKKYTILAILISLCSVLSYFDSIICSMIPTGIIQLKLGLANIVIMLIIYTYNIKEGIFAVLMKSILVSLFLGSGIISFLISLGGSLLSFLLMTILFNLMKKEENHKSIKQMTFVGMVGGFTHPIGQIIVVCLYYGFNDFILASLITAPILLVSGIITGIFVGGIAYKIVNRINPLIIKQ